MLDIGLSAQTKAFSKWSVFLCPWRYVYMTLQDLQSCSLFQGDISHLLFRVHTDCKQQSIPLKGLNQGVLVSLSWDVIGCFLSTRPIILLQSALVQVIMHYTNLFCEVLWWPVTWLQVILLVTGGNIWWKQGWCGEGLKEFERERACYGTSIHYSLVFCLWISGNLGCEFQLWLWFTCKTSR